LVACKWLINDGVKSWHCSTAPSVLPFLGGTGPSVLPGVVDN
jgi:hypothetical protein